MRNTMLPFASALASLLCAAGLVVVAPACSAGADVHSAPGPDPVGDASPDRIVVDEASTHPDAALPPACVPGQVWKASSARVEVSSFGFFEGSSGYDATRANLSAAQLAALDKLCVIPTPQGPEGADFTSYRVRIHDADGSAVEYRAAQGNVVDSDESPTSDATLDIHSLEPFLATFSCLSAADTRDYGAPSADAGTDPWSAAPTVSDDPSCINGLFAPYACHQVHMKLDIRAAGAKHIAFTHCFEGTRIRILAADGTTELAASAAATAPACASLDYTFAAAGTYDLVVEKTNVAGCSADGTGGDMTFTVTSP